MYLLTPYFTNILLIHYIDEGNVYLRNGEVSQAIDCYDKALKLGSYILLLLLLLLLHVQTINRSNNQSKYTTCIYIHTRVYR